MAVSEGERNESVAFTSAVREEVGFEEHRAVDVAGRTETIVTIARDDLEAVRISLMPEDPVFATANGEGFQATAGYLSVPHRLVDSVAGDLPAAVAEGLECEEDGMGKCFGGPRGAWFDGYFWRV